MTTIDTRHDIHIDGAPGVDAVFTDGRDPYFSVQLRAGSAMPALTISVDERNAEVFAERLAEAAASILETLRSRRFPEPPAREVLCHGVPLKVYEDDGAIAPTYKDQQAEACEEVARHGIGVTALDEHGQEVKVS